MGKRGKFISLEGGEGVGKSTQAEALANAIRARGIDVVLTREPGGSVGAEAIRELLMKGGVDRWSAQTEALLFAAARADHSEKTIRPALEDGKWVLCDRYLDSSRAYQGGAGGLTDDDVMTLHMIGSKGLLPDRTLLLTLDKAAAEARAITRDGGLVDRFAKKGSSYHDRVASAFDAFAAADQHRFRRIDAAGAAQDVTQRLIAAIDDLF